ncbi:MAG: hypothetical protein ACJ78Z_14800, partial [Myxococcales bacterium]
APEARVYPSLFISGARIHNSRLVSPDNRRLLSALQTADSDEYARFAYRELTVPLLPRPGKGAEWGVLVLVSFERGAGRTTIARGLVHAFARRGLRALRTEEGLSERPVRCDIVVVDEPVPTPGLLAAADEILVVVRPSVEAVCAAEARLRPYKARYLASRVDARTDVPALQAMRALLGARLLVTTIHEDPYLDDPGSQVRADFASLARELRRRVR